MASQKKRMPPNMNSVSAHRPCTRGCDVKISVRKRMIEREGACMERVTFRTGSCSLFAFPRPSFRAYVYITFGCLGKCCFGFSRITGARNKFSNAWQGYPSKQKKKSPPTVNCLWSCPSNDANPRPIVGERRRPRLCSLLFIGRFPLPRAARRRRARRH